MSAAAATPLVSPDRTLQDASIAALSLGTQSKKEEALTTTLKGWEDDSGHGVRSPHLLVHVFQKVYKLAELPTALKGNDMSDFDTLQVVCNKVKFTILFASVRELLGCSLWMDNNRFRRWENSRPQSRALHHC
jgi:hypothetical protein